MLELDERQKQLLQNLSSSDYLTSLLATDLALFKEVITLMKDAYGGINRSNIGSTGYWGLFKVCRKLVELDDAATLQFIVESGLRLPEEVPDNEPPLMIAAAEKGKLNTVRLLFEKGYKESKYSCDKSLIAAIHNRDLALINYLLENGVNANIYTKDSDRFPMSLDHMLVYVAKEAIANPDIDRTHFHAVFACLLHHGADLKEAFGRLRELAHNRETTLELTALLLQFIDQFKGQMTEDYYQHLVTILADVQSVIYGEQLIYALYNDKNEKAIELIEKGASLDNYDQYFESSSVSPLHIAAGKNNLVVAEALLKHGANINYDRGFTDNYFAVDCAIQKQHLDMIILLLNAGAKVTAGIYTKAPEEVQDLVDRHIMEPGRSELIAGLLKMTGPVRYGLFNHSPVTVSSNVAPMIVEEQVDVPEEGESDDSFLDVRYV